MSKKQSIIYTIQLSDWIFFDPNFKKKYTQYIPISLRLLGSRQFDLLSKAGKMLTISLIEEAHRLGRSEVEVREKFLRSQGEAVEKLLCDLEQNQIVTSSLINKEINKQINKESFLSNTSVLDKAVFSSKEKGEPVELDHKKETPLPPFNASFEIERIYKEFYPRKEGKTPALKRLTQKNKPKTGEADLRVLNKQDTLDFEKAVKIYAGIVAGREISKIKIFSTFAGEWRDYLDYAEDSKNKNESIKTNYFEGVAGVE